MCLRNTKKEEMRENRHEKHDLVTAMYPILNSNAL